MKSFWSLNAFKESQVLKKLIILIDVHLSSSWRVEIGLFLTRDKLGIKGYLFIILPNMDHSVLFQVQLDFAQKDWLDFGLFVVDFVLCVAG